MEWGEVVDQCPWRMVLDDGLARCKPVGEPCTNANCAPMYLAALWVYVESTRAASEIIKMISSISDDEVKQ